MAGVYGNIEIAVSNAARFSDSRTGDTLIYTDNNTQRICMGVQQNSNATVLISSNSIRFDQPFVTQGVETSGIQLVLNPSAIYIPSSLYGNAIPTLSASSNNSAVFSLCNTHTDIRFVSAYGCNLALITSNAQLQMNNNTSSNVPTFSWQGDSNTGMYLSSNSQIGFACAGSNVCNITTNGDLSINGNLSAQNFCMTRNKIINGDMRINQRMDGNGAMSNTSNVMQGFLVDRFAIDLASGSGLITGQQAPLTSNDAPYAKGLRYAGQVGISNAVAMLSNFSIRQTIEGFAIADMGWGRSNGYPATLSFWFKSTGGIGQYCTSTVVTTSGANTHCYYTSPFAYTTNNTWQYVSTVIPAPSSNIVFTTLSNAGAEIHISPLTSIVTNMRNAWTYGMPPVISITPYLTFPAYTSGGGTFPTINSDRYSFVGAVSSSNDAQYINFGTQTFSFGTIGFSLTCTFRFTGGTANSFERIIDFGSGSPNNNIILCRNSTTSNLLFAYFNGTSGTRYDAISTTSFQQNVIYNVALVYNAMQGATGVMYLYVNGVLEAQTSPAAKGTDRTVTCYVGRSSPTFSDVSFTGDIYSLNAYNRVISSAEIAAANTGNSNIQNWITQSYTIPYISVTTKTPFPKWNSTGGANPTFNTDRVTFSPGAVTSSSASCQFMNFGSRLFNIGTVGFSATCTFRFINTLSSSERIFDFASSAGSDNIICYRTGTNATLTFLINTSSATSGFVTSVGTFSQNTTYNIALIYNPAVGANGTLYFYVNGVLDASSAATSTVMDRTVSAAYVGKSWWGTDGALNADIYSLNIHNRVISAAEIAAANISSTNISTWESTAIAGNSLSVTGVQFEKGNLASPFEFRPYPYELMLCQRYFYKRFNESSNDRFGFWATDSNGGGGHSYYSIPFTMRSNCTSTLSAFDDFQYGTFASSYISFDDGSASTRSGVFGVTGSSTNAYTAFQINTLNKQPGSAYMAFDSEFSETRVLDLLSSSGRSAATAVYSLKSVSTAYTGPVVRVRRGTDNVEQDFYSSMAGALVSTSNGVSYSNWLGAATGYVTTWYDQSPQCLHAVQATTSRQPTLTTAGKMVFNGTSHFLDRPYSSTTNTNNFTLFITCTCYNIDNQYQSPVTSRSDPPQSGYIIYKLPTPTPNFTVFLGTGSAWSALATGVTPVANTVNKIFTKYVSGTLSSIINSVSASSNLTLSLNTTAPFRIGAGATEGTSGQFFWNGDITNVYYFNTGISDTDRNTIIEYFPGTFRVAALVNISGLATPYMAHSVRWLYPSYIGPIFRVSRSSDNAQTDVFVDGSGTVTSVSNNTEYNTSALTSWAGASTLRVVKLYDQSGNGRDLTNVAGANTLQAPIYYPASKMLQHDASLLMYSAPSDVTFTQFHMFIRGKHYSDYRTGTWRFVFGFANSTNTEYNSTATMSLKLSDGTSGSILNGLSFQRSTIDTMLATPTSYVNTLYTYDISADTTTSPDAHKIYVNNSYIGAPFTSSTKDTSLIFRYFMYGCRGMHPVGTFATAANDEQGKSDIYAYIIYNSLLSDPQRSAINTILNAVS